ncbi:MAG: hypothetical protein HY925_02300 [Elusimicrobia bacterium]|nr:hypothetical protein [Elusimicrobiota bacterium]
MGILRTREEYLPVTCAILKAEDREAFFSAIKKHPNSRPEHIARLCEVTVDAVNDWISGKANVPYHSLQTLAHNFETPMPAVGELRREYMAISQLPSRHETPTPPPPSKRTREAAKQPREEAPRRGKGKAGKQRREPRDDKRRQVPREDRQTAAPQAQPDSQPQQLPPQQPQQPPREPRRDDRPRRQDNRRDQRGRQPQQQRPQQPQQPRGGKPAPQGPRVPEPSEQLAFWVGITIVTGRRENGEVVMTADRRIGQNFAGTWANLTRDLFGVKPTLSMQDNGKLQEARLPVAGFEECLDRLDFKDGKSFNEAGVPRWAWSNPAWKAACLKGIVDGRAFFQRAPALVLEGIPERLAKAFQKMLSAFQLEAVIGPNNVLELKGVETLDKYFEKVGTGNMKLRDQYRAFRHPRDGRPSREDAGRPGPYTGVPATAATPASEEAAGEEEHHRVIAEEVEAADAEAEHHAEAEAEAQAEAQPEAAVEPASEGGGRNQDDLDAALDAAAARKAHASAQPSRFGDPPPQPKKDPKNFGGGRRKTLYRGRPRR